MSDYDENKDPISNYPLAASYQDYVTFTAYFAQDGELVEHGRSVPASVPFNLQMLSARARECMLQPDGNKHIKANTMIERPGGTARAVTEVDAVPREPVSTHKFPFSGELQGFGASKLTQRD